MFEGMKKAEFFENVRNMTSYEQYRLVTSLILNDETSLLLEIHDNVDFDTSVLNYAAGICAENGKLDTLRHFNETGAHMELVFSTIGPYVVKRGKLNVLKYFVEELGYVDISDIKPEMVTTAAAKGHIEICKYLLNKCNCNPSNIYDRLFMCKTQDIYDMLYDSVITYLENHLENY